jgi:hypothetical protein
VLILDQSAPLRPWATKIIGAIQASKSDRSGRPMTRRVKPRRDRIIGHSLARQQHNLRSDDVTIARRVPV